MFNRPLFRSLLAALAMAPYLALASASGPEDDAAATPPDAGTETRAWLHLQGSGVVQSPHPQALRGAEAEQAYERYLRSFTHAIPDTFIERGGFAP